MARSLLYFRVEGESKGAAMKEKKKRLVIGGALAVMVLAGCGSASSTNFDLGSESGGTGLTSSFDSPAVMGVGDIMPIEFGSDGSAAVDFDGVDTSSRFILVLGNAKEGGTGTSIQLSTSISDMMEGEAGISVEANLSSDDDMSADEVISTWMRAIEVDFAMNEPLPVEVSVGKAMDLSKVGAPVGMDSIRDFRMLNSLSSTTTYTTVRGKARCIGNNVIVYVDTRVTDELSQGEIDDICDNFDQDLGEEISLYGSLSDVDRNDKLIVFLSMQVNELGSLGGGIITGYF